MYGRIKLPSRFSSPDFIWGLGSYPATAPLANVPGGTKGREFRLDDRWIGIVKAMNVTEKAGDVVRAEHTGWCNRQNISECLTMWGNIVRIKEEAGSWYLLDSLQPGSFVDDLQSPFFRHRFTVITRNGLMRNPFFGLETYYPFVTNGPAYIHKSEIEIFESPPDPIWPGSMPTPKFTVIVRRGAFVRTRPGGNAAETPQRRLFDRPEGVYSDQGDWYQIGDRRWVLKSETRSQ